MREEGLNYWDGGWCSDGGRAEVERQILQWDEGVVWTAVGLRRKGSLGQNVDGPRPSVATSCRLYSLNLDTMMNVCTFTLFHGMYVLYAAVGIHGKYGAGLEPHEYQAN